jgi:hypothetical protein
VQIRTLRDLKGSGIPLQKGLIISLYTVSQRKFLSTTAYLDEGNPLFQQRDRDDENESSCRLIDGSVGRNTARVYKTLQPLS